MNLDFKDNNHNADNFMLNEIKEISNQINQDMRYWNKMNSTVKVTIFKAASSYHQLQKGKLLNFSARNSNFSIIFN